MTQRTITALYESRSEAESAKAQLDQVGVTSVEIHNDTAPPAVTGGAPHEGLMASIKHMFGSHEDTHGYAEGLRRGHFMLTAKVEEEDADEAIDVLEATPAIDFDEKQKEWRGAGWTAPTSAAAPVMNDKRAADDTIQIAEENLVVGKREVERGGVRVRSYIVETPVSQQVRLRDEHVDVQRHAVDRPLDAGQDAFRERTIEMTETGEEAVVGKEARIKEELVIKKDVGQRTEDVQDTVRHTEVEIERIDGKGETLRTA